jgi:hypothetical protein
VAGDVDDQVADLEVFGLWLLAATHASSDAGDELLRLERLDDVVVGSGLEADDNIHGVGPCSEHDDRHAGFGADPPAHLHAIQSWEHDVEEDEVGLGVTKGREHPGAVRYVGHLEPLVAQDDAEHLRQRQIVIDDEHATLHLRPPSSRVW